MCISYRKILLQVYPSTYLELEQPRISVSVGSPRTYPPEIPREASEALAQTLLVGCRSVKCTLDLSLLATRRQKGVMLFLTRAKGYSLHFCNERQMSKRKKQIYSIQVVLRDMEALKGKPKVPEKTVLILRLHEEWPVGWKCG